MTLIASTSREPIRTTPRTLLARRLLGPSLLSDLTLGRPALAIVLHRVSRPVVDLCLQ